MEEIGIGVGEVAVIGIGVVAVLVFGLGFILVVSWGVVRLFAGSSSPNPRAILADRLARGEITREEFDTAMRALGYGDRAH